MKIILKFQEHQNQVSEAINDQMKSLVVLNLLSKKSQKLKTLIKIQPETFKYKSKKSKVSFVNGFFLVNFLDLMHFNQLKMQLKNSINEILLEGQEAEY